MKPATLAKIGRAIREEIRTAALLDVPPDFRPPPPFDIEAERAVLATMFEGHRVPVAIQARDFWLPLHEAVFAALDTAMEENVELTAEGVAKLVERLGFKGREVLESVRCLSDATPFCIHFGRAAKRVSRLAEQRRARESLARIDAALCDLEADAERMKSIVTGLRRVADQLAGVTR